jgi:hypothetical protein
MRLYGGITGEEFQGIENVVATHLLHTPEQIARIIQHDPGIAAFLNQLGNDLGQTPVALGKWFGIVVIALAGVLQHVLQVGDQFSLRAGWNCGLVHVERTGKARADLIQVEIGARQKHRDGLLHQGQNFGF